MTIPGPRICACGRTLIGLQRTTCTLCRANDRHRHGARQNKIPEMFVSVDGEGRANPLGLMDLISFSFGREDGSCGSITIDNSEDRLTGPQVIEWLFESVQGIYTDANGQEFRQVPVAFHFSWDSAVIGKDFNNPDMFLVHKATAKERGILCDTEHEGDEPCFKLHRRNPEHIQLVITEGGEGDALAYDPGSDFAIAATPKRRFYAEYRPNGDRYEGNRRLDIHDTGTAFVGGLLRVLDVWQPKLADSQRAAIEWGKEARKDGFLSGTIEQVEEYSEAECVGHARVCRQLINSILDAGQIPIRPSELFGSGSVAGAAYKFHGVPTRKQYTVCDDVYGGLSVDDMARMTYFGGLIETPVLGLLTEPVDEADLNSAYPAQAIRLPCMRDGHGSWHRRSASRGRQTPPEGAVGHVLASWVVDSDTSTGPFVVRRRDGRVAQPLIGSRVWVTLPEFEAATERFGMAVWAHETLWWLPTCECVNPLAWIEQLYDARLAIKQDMELLEKGSPEWQALNCLQESIKLIINSCYGKLAQQRPTLGKYTNLHYAGYITGATRAEVRRESWRREAQGGTVVYTHTDSVLSTSGSPVDGGSGLGKWGLDRQSVGFVIVQPGLAVSLESGKAASRGCGIKEFRTAVEAWITTNDFTRPPLHWDPITIERTMMMSRRLAIARGKPELAGSFQPMPLKVQFNSDKRDVINARPMPGNPHAWLIPPNPGLYADEVATLADLKDYQSTLARLLKAGQFDIELVQ